MEKYSSLTDFEIRHVDSPLDIATEGKGYSSPREMEKETHREVSLVGGARGRGPYVEGIVGGRGSGNNRN